MSIIHRTTMGAALAFAAAWSVQPAAAQEAYIGSITLMATTYCPQNSLATQGQALPIVQYQALYSLLGDRFGGDEKTSFNLPSLDAPGKGLLYCIAVNGEYPVRPDSAAARRR